MVSDGRIRGASVKPHWEPAQVELVERALTLELDQSPIDDLANRVMAGRDGDGEAFAEQVRPEIGFAGKAAAAQIVIEPERGAHGIAEERLRLVVLHGG